MQKSKYEAAHPLFEPVAILPAQFFATIPSGVLHKSAEHRLLWAILADAINCFQKFGHATNRKKRRLFDEAECWIMDQGVQPTVADDATQRRFVFEDVCTALGLDADYLRDGLRRWRDAQTARSTSLGDLGRCER